MISPMHIEGITNVDLYMMLVSTIMIWFFSFTKYTIERWGGSRPRAHLWRLHVVPPRLKQGKSWSPFA